MKKNCFELNYCPNCKGTNLFKLESDSWLCINKECKSIIEISSKTCDDLSFWIWNKQYNKTK
jgi:hypothetical protein